MENPKSLKEEFEHANGIRRSLESLTARRDSAEYQEKVREAVQSYQRCHELINRLSLFSTNETLEDVSTGDIQYMSVEYYAGTMTEKIHRGLEGRLDVLRAAASHYMGFLRLIDNYGLLNKDMAKRLGTITTLKDLAKLTPTDGVKKRTEKVEQFKKEKELQAQIEALKDETDEEIQRKLYGLQVEFNAVQAVKALQTMASEAELLESMPAAPARQDDSEPERTRESSTGYTTRVEAPALGPGNKGPLLNKQGKVMRPFTIVPSRDKIAQNIFGTGQVLPTMTVEEYLDEEMKRGNVITGGGEASAKQDDDSDEDNEAKADAETYRLRKWDEFTDSVAKGSGNTYNRG